MRKIATAIHHAHQRGILHRDLKPANVLIDLQGEPVVTDFGLARATEGDQQLTQTGAVVGTPGFMSPEQAAGAGVTTATDIYSLGAILYHLLCGQPPHQKESVLETLISVMNSEPLAPRKLNPAESPDLELICLKCLAKNPATRYASAAELEAELAAYQAGEPLQVRPPSTWEVLRRWTHSNFGNIIWAPIIALIVRPLSGFLIWIDTVAGDISDMSWVYDQFSSDERPWLAKDLSSIQGWGFPLFTLITAVLGWLTAILVRTKNQTADLGVGLSVGMLTGRTAFIFALGPMSIVGNVWQNRNDGFLIG